MIARLSFSHVGSPDWPVPHKPDILPRDKTVLARVLAPTREESLAQVDDLRAVYGDDLARVLGVPSQTLSDWHTKKAFETATRRAIWLTWCLTFRPDMIRSAFDLVTWGRTAPNQPVFGKVKPVEKQLDPPATL